MADPLKVFTGLLDALGEESAATKAVKPTAPLKGAKTAAKGYFDDIAGKAKTAADYFADIVKTKQNVPPKPTVDQTQKALDAIYEALGLPPDYVPPKPVPVPKPAPVPAYKPHYPIGTVSDEPAPPAPKPFNFAHTAVKTAQQQQLKLPPTVKPPTMHPDVLPEAERQAARLEGNYVTEAFRGVKVAPGGDFQGQFKGGELYSSVSPKLADLYTSYISKHPGLNPPAGSYHEGASTVPLWIDTSDYLKVDAKGAKWTAFNAKAIAEAKAQGKKGVVIDNVWDEPNSTQSLEGPQKIFITFPNGQSTVKSKFAARFDPKSTDISRSIAAVGITGAAGTIAMAPGDAKAGEDPAALPENAEPTAGEGYFSDLLKPKNYFDDLVRPAGMFDDIPAKSSGMFDDIPAAKPPAGMFDDIPARDPKQVSIFFRSPDDPNALASSTHSGVGRVKDIPTDIYSVYQESLQEYKEGKRKASEAISKEEIQQYDAYEKAYKAWEDAGGKGPPPQAPDTGPLKFFKGVTGAAGGLFGVVTSPLMGAFRALVSRPTEEKTGLKHEITEAVGSLVLPGGGVIKYGSAVKKATTVARDVAAGFDKIFAPEKLGKGDRAATLVRNALGVAARDTAQTRAAFDAYFKTVNQLTPKEQASLIAYIEGRTKGVTLQDPALQPVADAIRDAVQKRQVKLQNLPSTHQMAFVEDYYTHQWEDPQAASQFTKAWFGGKQGTGKNLKKRSIPTIADGMAAGLVPKTLNPLETITDYVTNMDRFIAHNAAFDAGRHVKDIKFYANPAIARKLGLVPLKGRLSQKMVTTKNGAVFNMQAYADPDFARVYNNAISRGWVELGAMAGKIYDKAQTASNSMTALELGLSAYHLSTMIYEGSVASLANSVGQAVAGAAALGRGQMAEAAKLLAGSAKSAATAPFALGMKPFMGWKAQNVYLGRQTGSAIMKQTMDLLEAAGGRAVGRTHAADYKFTAANSYFTAFRRGELAASIRSDFSKGLVSGLARQVGRTLQSFSQPLFEVYIPKMKVGAFHENMAAWLTANPTASYADQVSVAKKIWDSVDNRFGELVQDNIFWNAALKQTAQLAMRSYSWNLGTVREIAGGAISATTKPKGFSIKGTGYDPRTGYVVALPMMVGLSNAIYQYAMTGKMPESVDDLVAPRTGGVVPGFGGRGQVEERAQLPGYQKDVFGWYEDWRREAGDKLSSFVGTSKELLENRDWKGDFISPPEASAPEWMKNYFMHVIGKGLPISVKQGIQGEKKGSQIPLWQEVLGIRPSPAQFTDPKGKASFEHYQTEQWEKKRRKTEAKQKQVYGGPTE